MSSARVGAARPKSQIKVSRTGTSNFGSPRAPKRAILRNEVVIGDTVEVMLSLPEASVELVFADPPYNLQLANRLTRPDQSVVDAVDDDWDKFADFATYDAFTRDWLAAARRAMKPNATIFVIGSYHNIFRVGAIMQDLGFWILNDIVWRKNNPMPNFRGRRFTNAHETMIWAARDASARNYTFHYEALKAGNEDCQMRSDWLLPICSGGERLKDASGRKTHPTQKPEALLARILLAASNPGDLVLDPFFGSGTTGAAARLLRPRLSRHRARSRPMPPRRARASPRSRLCRPRRWRSAPSKRTEPRIAFASVVEAGLVAPGATLTDARRRHTAVVRADGALAIGAIVGSIHKTGALVQGLPACNGWTFWHFESGAGLAPIDDLRAVARARLRDAAE